MHKLLSDKRTIFLLIAPGFLLCLLLIFVPIVISFFYSLTNWDGVSSYKMIGFANFNDILFHDPVFWKSLLNALLLGAGLVLVQHPISIVVAMLVQYTGRWEKLLRIVIFIPSIISSFITTKLWVSVFNTQFGLLNRVLEIVGLSTWKQDWLGDSKLAIMCIIFVCAWQGFGYAFLLYYAGIKGIPRELHEAAMIDGASNRQVNFKIVLPLLTPVIRINLVLAVVAAFKQMETVFLMTGGGPANATQFLSTYLYSKTFREGLYGYGNAISVLLVVICLLVTLFMDKILKREVGEF
ncbi:MAG: msmF 3 [Bacilli bacterium]|nr:msmF 3 [Bacilli bacterium]